MDFNDRYFVETGQEPSWMNGSYGAIHLMI